MVGMSSIVAMQNESGDIAPPRGGKERDFCKARRRAMRKWRSELNELILLSVVYARGLNYWSSSDQLKPKRLMQIGRMSALGH
jgi:hypothetical protein